VFVVFEETQEIKQEQVGEAIATISSGPFKGYKIMERTMITNVIFTGNYEKNGMPIFNVFSAKTSIPMKPKINVKREMK
jgi:hypothetical protein